MALEHSEMSCIVTNTEVLVCESWDKCLEMQICWNCKVWESALVKAARTKSLGRRHS